jgi:UPF0271 protein
MASNRSRYTVDLATELGESFALPPAGITLEHLRSHGADGRPLHPRHSMGRDDAALLDMISTGYVACGAHAGDAIVMGRTVRTLVDAGIAIGAHPSYPDIMGFGQLALDLPDREFQDMVILQVAGLQAIARAAGGTVASVKCHGALAFDVSYDERTAQVMARTLQKLDPMIALVCMAGSPGARVALDCGLRVVEEAYIDRAYDADGRIVSRHHPKALIVDPAAAVEQFRSILEDRAVVSADGKQVPLRADSFCLHSDTPNAGEIAASIRAVIAAKGIAVRAARGRIVRRSIAQAAPPQSFRS